MGRLGLPLLVVLVACLLAAPSAESTGRSLALVGGTVFVSPEEPPIIDGTVLVRDGRIVAVGPRDEVELPVGTERIDCSGRYLTAGFQNSHVHFTESKWESSATQAAETLEKHLLEMFGQYGFTTVLDTASWLENTLALIDRIETGEVAGPRILTAGNALYPFEGIPFYLRDSMSEEELARLQTPANAREATRQVEENLSAGADALKLFAVSWMGRGATQEMAPEVARAAAGRARQSGALVLAHPSNTRGLEIALDAGVEVLVHAVEDRRGWTPDLTERMLEGEMAVVPTLKLFDRDRFLWEILDGLGEFARSGGRVLFGTDAGFLPVYDPRDEFVWMGAAGLSPLEILASLTTTPAAVFGESERRGRIAPGMDADLVVLGADPRNSALAFTQVERTIRGGRVLYQGEVPR